MEAGLLADAGQELTLKALATFVTVARAGSVSGAAAHLGLAQSAISRQVAELERMFGGALFYRTGRGVRPTALAEQVLADAEPLLAGARQLVEAARGQAGNVSGVLTVGLVPAVAPLLASRLYAAVCERLPALRLRFVEGYSGDIETRLTQGSVDLAVLNRYRAEGRNSYRRLFDTPLMLVGSRASMRAHWRTAGGVPPSMPMRQMAGLPLVLPVPPNAIRNLLDELSSAQRIALNVCMEASSSVVIKRILTDHTAYSVLPYHAVSTELDSGELEAVALTDRALRQSVVLATSSQRPFTAAARQVAQIIPKLAEALIQEGRWRRV
ncbi:LysR family transcriptional regulator [Cupriavidus basilensis]|uniref:LysR family transcriptional regulator n=1 Tax=Cupriavidus basilensis TaxID=68895 RepID=UPI0005B857D9|nr:LysR family transcriptional regulator [Cupriavidus basilensis]